MRDFTEVFGRTVLEQPFAVVDVVDRVESRGRSNSTRSRYSPTAIVITMSMISVLRRSSSSICDEVAQLLAGLRRRSPPCNFSTDRRDLRASGCAPASSSRGSSPPAAGRAASSARRARSMRATCSIEHARATRSGSKSKSSSMASSKSRSRRPAAARPGAPPAAGCKHALHQRLQQARRIAAR